MLWRRTLSMKMSGQLHASKTTVFWNVAVCCLVESDRRFRDAYCHHQDDELIEAPLKRRSSSTRQHGATTQKAVVFTIAALTVSSRFGSFSDVSRYCDVWQFFKWKKIVMILTVVVWVVTTSKLQAYSITSSNYLQDYTASQPRLPQSIYSPPRISTQ
jgi:hypothetical protein